MGSLLRKSMIGDSISIRFNCEIAKTYFEGHHTIAHQNVILDSIIVRNVWFGGLASDDSSYVTGIDCSSIGVGHKSK